MTAEERFQSCIVSILEHEGGLTDDSRDPGGITNWGIDLRFMLQEDSEDHPTAETIRTLTKPEAIEIYRKYWWDKFHYAAFNQLVVVEKVFDMAVNMGHSTAMRILQNAINSISARKILVDGILGSITLELANLLEATKLREQLRIGAKERYLAIVKKNPHMEWALKGWLHRAEW